MARVAPHWFGLFGTWVGRLARTERAMPHEALADDELLGT